MGRFHRHDNGTGHDHHHDGHEHDHSHSHSHDHPHDHDLDYHPDLTPVTGTAHLNDAAHQEAIGDHSGYATGGERIDVLERIFSENDRKAEANRAAFDAAGVRVVNLMSSPGAGKTTLLSRTLKSLSGHLRIGIIEGDIETSLDADHLHADAAQVSLLNTGNGFGGECHLDAPMVSRALEQLDLDQLDLLVIENVGNLVCPAEFDVGEHVKAMVASVTEGEDKPLKYPVMFKSVDAVVINKVDLLPHLDFDLEALISNIRDVNPAAHIFQVSARTGEGMQPWLDWVRSSI
ncbi:hydrogenase nickel incorporation protein HypB [Devriesea agamarum]|uniref:hydrogenase nickel incorporation protein HypB n=1 Tax=Devriesea agamarum TaxID=472569 RepID=UPI00071CA10D|nr:hydrogenase nickel incorporation protein HypB [Devriesea agamarum]